VRAQSVGYGCALTGLFEVASRWVVCVQTQKSLCQEVNRVGDQLHEAGSCIEGGCVAGPFYPMRSRPGDGSGERSGAADDEIGLRPP
jgi:hypothetical protein